MAVVNLNPFIAFVMGAVLIAGIARIIGATPRTAMAVFKARPMLGLFAIGAAFLAPQALLASIVAVLAGVFMLASGLNPQTVPELRPVEPTHQVVAVAEPAAQRVFKAGGGIVVFTQVNGKLVSRFYRDSIKA